MSMRSENRAQYVGHGFEPEAVFFIESGRRVRIEIEYRDEITAASNNRNDDFGLGLAVAHDVARKGMNIGNQHGLAPARGGPADTAVEVDLEAAQGSLVRAHAKQPVFDDSVKASPAGIGNRLVKNRRCAGHDRHRVIEFAYHLGDLLSNRSIDVCLDHGRGV